MATSATLHVVYIDDCRKGSYWANCAASLFRAKTGDVVVLTENEKTFQSETEYHLVKRMIDGIVTNLLSDEDTTKLQRNGLHRMVFYDYRGVEMPQQLTKTTDSTKKRIKKIFSQPDAQAGEADVTFDTEKEATVFYTASAAAEAATSGGEIRMIAFAAFIEDSISQDREIHVNYGDDHGVRIYSTLYGSPPSMIFNDISLFGEESILWIRSEAVK